MDIMLYLLIAILIMLIVLIIMHIMRPKESYSDDISRLQDIQMSSTESLRKQLIDNERYLKQQLESSIQSLQMTHKTTQEDVQTQLRTSLTNIKTFTEELGKMQEIGRKIEKLDKVLTAPKGRGSLGETGLEELLKTCLPDDLYAFQYSIGAGKVDAVIHTTRGIIPIDAKFPLPAYEKMVLTDDIDTRLKAEKELTDALKNRIKEASKYINTGHNTVPFGMMYLPLEGLYYAATVHLDGVLEYAREHKIIITGPNTLYYILQIILQAYHSQQFSMRAEAALKELGGVKKHIVEAIEEYRILKNHLHNVYKKVPDIDKLHDKINADIDKMTSGSDVLL